MIDKVDCLLVAASCFLIAAFIAYAFLGGGF
jgi:hypothetical protein